MNTQNILAALVVTTFLIPAAFVPANAQQTDHHPDAAKTRAVQSAPGGKPGMMGKGGMMGMMGKGGMMGMMQKKMMGHMGFMRAKPLSTDDVKRVIDGRLSMRGFSRLQVANVKTKDDNVATADIVTTKGELVAKLTVNRQTGMTRIVN